MSTFRLILDDVPVSTSLNSLSHFGERLYWRLLSQTDQWGRLPGERVKIRDLCVPRLAISDNELAEALEELVRASRIALYCADGEWVCQLLDFDRHQAFTKRRRASRYPAPQSDSHSGEMPPGKPLQRAVPTDRETETAEQTSLGSSYVPLDVELPELKSESESKSSQDERLRFHKFDLGDLSRSLRGADDRTPYAIASVLRGMPEAALASAIEQLERRRQKTPRLDSEVRYLVGTLSTMRREGQYA